MISSPLYCFLHNQVGRWGFGWHGHLSSSFALKMQEIMAPTTQGCSLQERTSASHLHDPPISPKCFPFNTRHTRFFLQDGLFTYLGSFLEGRKPYFSLVLVHPILQFMQAVQVRRCTNIQTTVPVSRLKILPRPEQLGSSFLSGALTGSAFPEACRTQKRRDTMSPGTGSGLLFPL